VPGLPVPGADPYEVIWESPYRRERVLVLEKGVVSLSGVWDLPMMGSESWTWNTDFSN
jgi:hypothetical protein